jgi:hypothetical protein
VNLNQTKFSLLKSSNIIDNVFSSMPVQFKYDLHLRFTRVMNKIGTNLDFETYDY